MQFYLNQICLKNDSMNIYHFPLTVNHKFFCISYTIQIAQHAFFPTNPLFSRHAKSRSRKSSDFPLPLFTHFYAILQLLLFCCLFGKFDCSSNCFSSTVPGASVIRQEASFTFGNAITSRIESACTICITIRSKP